MKPAGNPDRRSIAGDTLALTGFDILEAQHSLA
jgi:hypothetical protein